MKILIGCVLAAAFGAGAPQEPTTTNGGRCTIQATFSACQVCCEIDRRVGGVLESACQTGTIAIGARVGGVYGASAGRFLSGIACALMLQESTCEDRCIGKDGDPSPIPCTSALGSDDAGVCRQVCEQGQHDVGPGTCSEGFSVDLRCCVNEYDPPGDEACPDILCPGVSCPEWCPNRF